jgi:hypothetical protein
MKLGGKNSDFNRYTQYARVNFRFFMPNGVAACLFAFAPKRKNANFAGFLMICKLT